MDEDFFNRLKERLKEDTTWPAIYMFKFIVPSDNRKIARVEQLFNAEEASVSLRESRNGKYTSVTAKELMISPERVIDRYKEAAEIEGLIAL